MKKALSPKAANALLYLLYSRVPLHCSRLGLKFRKELVAGGWTEEVKEGQKVFIHLRDAAWDRLTEAFPIVADPAHLARVREPGRDKQGRLRKAPVLQEAETVDVANQVIRRILLRGDDGLAELTAKATDGPSDRNNGDGKPSPRPPNRLQQRVVEAYLRLSGGELHRDVRVAALRAALPEVSSAAFDELLVQMKEQGFLTSFALEDPRTRTDADEANAWILAGQPQHCVILKKG